MGSGHRLDSGAGEAQRPRLLYGLGLAVLVWFCCGPDSVPPAKGRSENPFDSGLRAVAPVASGFQENGSDMVRAEAGVLSSAVVGAEDPFAGAEVLSQSGLVAVGDGLFRRTRVLRSAVVPKYPLVRVEETVAQEELGGGGVRERLIQRVAMAASHLLLRLAPAGDEASLRRLCERHGARVLRRMRVRGPGTYLVAIAGRDCEALPRALAELGREGGAVAYAEPDYLVQAIGTTPDDPRFGELYGMHNTGQTGGTADADIDAPEAWDIERGSRAVKVGVIDTGAEYSHEDLAANIWTNPGEIPGNGLDDDANGFVDDVRGWDFANDDNDPRDGHFHGTHVSGTIGGVGNNGKGVAGVCWNVSLVPLKFLTDAGWGSLSDGIEAVYYATDLGLDLTSNSWGGGGYSQALKDAISDAGAHGLLFVAAAGNSGQNADTYPMYPAAYDNSNILSVAATSHTDSLAGFSNYGVLSVDLAAPGVNTLSCGLNNGYLVASGTSMATPHVSGACALLKSLAPALTADQIKAQILSTVDPVPGLAGKCVTGGRLNVFKALQLSSGPFVSYRRYEKADDGQGGTAGNGDGIANPGERVGLQVFLRNVGSQVASGSSALLSLATPDPQITLVQPSVSYGDLATGAEGSGAGLFLLDIAAGTPTPRLVQFSLAIQDTNGHNWSGAFSLTVQSSCLISGQVAAATGGAPIAGATLTYTGPLSGTVTTAAGGEYSFTAIDGAYSLVARAAGYLDSSPVAVTVPPSAAHIDFLLGNPEIDVSPASLSATAEEGAATTLPLLIRNLGDAPLSFQAVAEGTLWTMDGMWHETAHRSRASSRSCYYGLEGQWNYDNGGASRGALTSGTLTLPGAAAELTFWEWRQTEEGGDYDQSLVQISTDGGATWATVYQELDTGGTWIQATVDLSSYAGLPVKLRFLFDTVDALFNGYEGWYVEEVAVNGQPLEWLTVSPATGTVAAGGGQAVSVGLSAAHLVPGVYHSQVLCSSNDPSQPQVQVPVAFTVVSAPRMEYAAHVVDDDLLGSSAGDGDGYAEPGERIELWLSLGNVGHGAAQGLTGELACSDPYITLSGSSTAFPNAGAGAVVSGTVPFVLQIANNTPNGRPVVLDLEVRDGNGHVWNSSFTGVVEWRHTLSGVVRDLGSGAALAGVAIGAAGRGATTAADGSYRLNGLPPGTHTVTASKAGYTAASRPAVVPPDGVLDFQLGYPNLVPSQASLSQVLPKRAARSQALTLTNTGSLPLSWAASAGREGYVILDSDSLGGPQYAWQEIAGTGTPIGGLEDDTNAGPFPLGFSFPLHGQVFSTVRVCSNGWLSFTNDEDATYYNTGLPNAQAPENLVAFFWDDLDFTFGGAAFYQRLDAGTFVVEFQDVPFYGDYTKRVSCQVLLKADGSMCFQYQRVDLTDSCTVGLQNAARDRGPQVVYDQVYLHDALAIQLLPAAGWLGISPSGGTIGPGQSADLAVSFNSNGVAEGVHRTFLALSSNDPEASTVAVPVTLTVVNHAPQANEQAVQLAEDSSVAITLTAGDADGDPVSYRVTGGPAHGTLSGTAPWLTYRPAADFHGTDSLEFRAGDGVLESPATTIRITIDPVNDSPVLGSGIIAVPHSPRLGETVRFQAGASDADGDALTYSWDFGDGSYGTGPAPTHLYGAAQTYWATVVVSDGKVSCSASISITVSAEALQVQRQQMRLLFGATGRDSVLLQIQLAVPLDFQVDGATVTVDVGGAAGTFTLNQQGRGRVAQNSCALRNRGTALLSVALRGGSWAGAWAAHGLLEEDLRDVPVSVPVTVTLNGRVYLGRAYGVYTARRGKSGMAR